MLGTHTRNACTTPINLGTSTIADAVEVIPAAVTTTGLYYTYADHLNTVRVLTRPSDNKMVWRWDNADAFGVTPPNDNPSAIGSLTYNPRFPGQVYDKETNLHYNYFRDYDPAIGRYIESDPFGLGGGINTYTYVGGNPVSIVDNLGLWGLVLNGDASYYFGPGTSIGGGLYYSPDGCASGGGAGNGSGGYYTYGGVGGGANVGITGSTGFFVGTGTGSFEGGGYTNNLSLGPLSLSFGYSGGHFASFEIGLTAETPDILLAGAAGVKTQTTVHPIGKKSKCGCP